MSAAFLLTTQAMEDLDDIWWFIERDNREAADRMEAAILATCRRLAEYPLIGHHRRDITPLPVRFWTLPKYPIRYHLPSGDQAAASGGYSSWEAGHGRDLERSDVGEIVMKSARTMQTRRSAPHAKTT